MSKILFYPQSIAGGQRMFHYVKKLGVQYTNDPTDKDISLVHYYDYRNKVDDLPEELKPLMDKGIYIVNGHLRSIMKDDIDKIATSILGYSIMVNPTTHHGACVLNTTQNAVKIAQIIQCPIEPHQVDTMIRPSKTGVPHRRLYMRLIDTRISQDTIRDYRIVVMGYKPVLLFEKHIDVKGTFFPKGDQFIHAYAYDTLTNHFTDQEIENIHRFIIQSKFEWGEIDVLRSNYDGRIYIIDTNDIPAGPIFNHIDDGEDIIDQLAQTYKKLYLS